MSIEGMPPGAEQGLSNNDRKMMNLPVSEESEEKTPDVLEQNTESASSAREIIEEAVSIDQLIRLIEEEKVTLTSETLGEISTEDLSMLLVNVHKMDQPVSRLPRAEGFREKVSSLFIDRSNTVDELKENIINYGIELEGSSDVHSPQELVQIIDDVLDGKQPDNVITRTAGLRGRVRELMKQNQRD